MEFSSESDIININKHNNTSLRQYKALYIDEKSPATYSIKFNNLIRGEEYKLKCIAMSPEWKKLF